MTYIVHRYGQPAQPQPLARVGQTSAVGVVRLMVGGRRLTCRTSCAASCTRGGRGRGRAVVACGVEVVTHLLRVRTIFPHLIATHLHLLTQLICNSAAALSRHRPTVATLAHSTSCTHARTGHALHCAPFFACVLFFLATLYRRASLALVSSTLT